MRPTIVEHGGPNLDVTSCEDAPSGMRDVRDAQPELNASHPKEGVGVLPGRGRGLHTMPVLCSDRAEGGRGAAGRRGGRLSCSRVGRARGVAGERTAVHGAHERETGR